MADHKSTTTTLRPTQYLTAPDQEQEQNGHVEEDTSRDDIALIILNSPIEDFEYFHRLYTHASYTLCADGGADRLHNLIITKYPDLQSDVALRNTLPNAIHGDLDSLSATTRASYAKLGVEISQDPDQYSTDFGKAIAKVLSTKPTTRDLLVLGSVGGRVDQGIGLLHELYREQKFRHPEVRFWLFSEASGGMAHLVVDTVTEHTCDKPILMEGDSSILPRKAAPRTAAADAPTPTHFQPASADPEVCWL
ncbi:hypothetical protein MBLNU13_g03890t1 [Cladosporium sp. NU13]